MFAVFLGVLTAAGLLNAVVIRLALSPPVLMADAAERVRDGDLDARVPPSPLADRTTQGLTEVFDRMLDAVQSGRRKQGDPRRGGPRSRRDPRAGPASASPWPGLPDRALPRRAPRRGGIVGMRERARYAGGQLLLEATPGGGSTVCVELPWATDDGGQGSPGVYRTQERPALTATPHPS